MDPITLPLIDAHSEKGPPPRTLRGIEVTEQEYKSYKWAEYIFPEFGPARYCFPNRNRRATEIVLPLGGRNYKILLRTESDRQGIPAGGEITFVPTEEPETPYSLDQIGSPKVIVFGQPRFIQSPVTPSFNGRCASNLLTLETGWGDAGNWNLLCALDEQKGIPAKVWFEASCC